LKRSIETAKVPTIPTLASYQLLLARGAQALRLPPLCLLSSLRQLGSNTNSILYG
jgi:hypothetical protein